METGSVKSDPEPVLLGAIHVVYSTRRFRQNARNDSFRIKVFQRHSPRDSCKLILAVGQSANLSC